MDTVRKLNVHRTIRRHPRCLLNVLCKSNLHHASKGSSLQEKMHNRFDTNTCSKSTINTSQRCLWMMIQCLYCNSERNLIYHLLLQNLLFACHDLLSSGCFKCILEVFVSFLKDLCCVKTRYHSMIFLCSHLRHSSSIKYNSRQFVTLIESFSFALPVTVLNVRLFFLQPKK